MIWFGLELFGPEWPLRRHAGAPRQSVRSRSILAEEVDVSIATARIGPHRPHLDRLGGETVGRSRRLRLLGLRAGTLPGRQDAPFAEQRRGELAEGREAADRPGGHQLIGLATLPGGPGLGALADDRGVAET